MVNRLRKVRNQLSGATPAAGPLDIVLQRMGLPGVITRQIIIDFQELRPYWPILIPLMIIVAVRSYRRERAIILAARHARLRG